MNIIWFMVSMNPETNQISFRGWCYGSPMVADDAARQAVRQSNLDYWNHPYHAFPYSDEAVWASQFTMWLASRGFRDFARTLQQVVLIRDYLANEVAQSFGGIDKLIYAITQNQSR